MTPSRTAVVVSVALIFSCVAATAHADPIVPLNNRPVVVNTIPTEPSLQSLVDAMFGPGLNVVVDQARDGMWRLDGTGMMPALAFEYAGYNAINSFGVWSATDTGSVFSVPIFLGAATGTGSGPVTEAFVSWNALGTLMTVTGSCAVLNCGTFANISPVGFGFYMQVGTNPLFYTLDQLNTNGEARSVAIHKPSSTDWLIAFEDRNDHDYNDGVLTVKSIAPVSPVPEPATLLMFGTGSAALAGYRALKRRRTKAGKNVED